MEEKHILVKLIEDYINGEITLEIFQRYYYDLYHFYINHDEIDEYDLINLKKVSHVVVYYVNDNLVDYPYFNDKVLFDNTVLEAYKNISQYL